MTYVRYTVFSFTFLHSSLLYNYFSCTEYRRIHIYGSSRNILNDRMQPKRQKVYTTFPQPRSRSGIAKGEGAEGEDARLPSLTPPNPSLTMPTMTPMLLADRGIQSTALVPLSGSSSISPIGQLGREANSHAPPLNSLSGPPVSGDAKDLAVVPFSGSPGAHRGSHSPYGDPTSMQVSTRRVCPHCLRPYNDVEMDNCIGTEEEEEEDCTGYFPRSIATRTRPTRRQHSQRHLIATTPADYTDSSSLQGNNLQFPMLALTAHYFRALPPPPSCMKDGAVVPCLAIADKEYNRTSATIPAPTSLPSTFQPAPATESYYNYVSPSTYPDTDTFGFGNVDKDIARRNTSSSIPLKDEEDEDGRENSADTDSATFPDSNHGYYKHYFKELRQLGRGTFGGVFLCRHTMCGVSLGDFALKKIPVGDKAAYLQAVLREVRILEEVKRHPNVVEYKHSWVEEAQLADFGPPVRCLFILMEYASEGSLDSYLERHGPTLSNMAVWYFFLSAVAGTAHLHRKKILHRDLKPQNLLLASTKDGPPRVLVSDFGTAALLGDISYERSGGTGTMEYMAPELMETTMSPLGAKERYVNQHTTASDVWSLGMVLYYLAYDATLPARQADGGIVFDPVRRATNGRQPEMIQLIEAMLKRDPAKRPRCEDILKSSIVQSILQTFNREDPEQWNASPRPSTPPPSTPPSTPPQRTRQGSVLSHPVLPGRMEMTLSDTTVTNVGSLQNTYALKPEQRESGNVVEGEEGDVLQSSRVELISTSAVVDLQGFNDGRGAKMVSTADKGGQSLVWQRRGVSSGRMAPGSPIPLAFTSRHVPTPARKTVDVSVQTDDVVILDKAK